MTTHGPKTAAADALHALKYRGPGEDFREAVNRWAFGLKDSDAHYHQLRSIFLSMRFLLAGRIQNSIGSIRQTTPYNCFVSGTIVDAYVGPGSIMDRATEAAQTMRMGGGIGYDFSTLRPRGDPIRTIQSQASGPGSFMPIFNAVCLATKSSGHRRGAQMGVLRVDHPDIEEFVKLKQNTTQLTGFNISVAVTDEFMEAALSDGEFVLRFNGTPYRTVSAAALWESIMRSTWDWAEPGVIFIDRINEMNNLYYCETIAATNPCAEQPLPPNGACLLGSFNLVGYLTPSPYRFDWDMFSADIPAIVRAMDNIVDRARYPLAAQKAEAITKRRMGLGITGLANTAEALGMAYGTPAFIEFEEKILGRLCIGAYEASSDLAAEKGSFPYFDVDKFLNGAFIKQLPEPLLERIKRNGLRNSHLTSIAPTGTISMCADNVSSGLEPVFAYEMKRPIETLDGPIIATIGDYGAEQLGVRGRLAADVTAKEHINVLIAAQKYVDSSVSKTVNMDGAKMPWNDFKDLYRLAWQGGAKGCSTFNVSGSRGALLVDTSSVEAPACRVDPETGQKECA